MRSLHSRKPRFVHNTRASDFFGGLEYFAYFSTPKKDKTHVCAI